MKNIARTKVVIIAALACLCGSVRAAGFFDGSGGQPRISTFQGSAIDDPAYHTPAEIKERIFFIRDSLRSAGLRIMRIDSIGYSQADRMPIYCIKIADNDSDYVNNKPSVVFIGQVHAEEVLGVEYVMRLITRVAGRSRWYRNVNIYIVPTANPEGLEVVHNFDYTYRKNKRDNIGDGLFRCVVDIGKDTSGVDINRNFPLFWHNGPAFLATGDAESFDYYRGSNPASEPETQALIRLIERVRPIYSVVLHSSRTGNVKEQVIYPWAFAERDAFDKKLSPDQQFLDEFANAVALRCKKHGNPNDHYTPVRILQTKGDSEVYFYWKYGVFAMRLEIGGSDNAMQPDSAGIYAVMNDIKLGLDYLLNSAAGITPDDLGAVIRSRLVITVTDAQTSQPLAAKLVIPALTNRLLPVRSANPLNGMFFWAAPSALPYRLAASAFGYKDTTISRNSGADPARINFTLQRLPLCNVDFEMTSQGLPTAYPLTIDIDHPDSSWSFVRNSHRFQLTLPYGTYTMTFSSGENYVPRRISVSIISDTTLHIGLAAAKTLLRQNFDCGDVTYTSDYRMNLNGLDSLKGWELTNVYYSPPNSFTDSRYGNTIRGEDSWGAPYNMFDTWFDLSSCSTAALVYYLNQALEPGYDSLWVEVSTGNSNEPDPHNWTWTQTAPAHQELAFLDSIPLRPWNAPTQRLMRYNKWQRFVVPLDAYCGQPVVHFRFHLRSDYYIEEDGVYIDDVLLLASSENPPAVSAQPLLPVKFALGAAYPNPFNSSTRFMLAVPVAGKVDIKLYDLNGRKVKIITDGEFIPGVHYLSADGSALPAGLYFLRASGPEGAVITHKFTIVK